MAQIKYFRVSASLSMWGVLSAVSLLLMSCASLVTDPVVEVLIESEPPNATVLYRGSPLGTTPLKIFVPSKTKDEQRRKMFRVERVGYRSATVNIYSSRNPYTLGNVLFTSTTSGAPSFLTDTYTDYAHTFSDESIVVELKKIPTEEEVEREGVSKKAEEQKKKDRQRLEELKRLKQEKEEALKKIKEEQAQREALDRERLAAEQARLQAEREARDREALKRAEADAKAKAEAEALAKREAEAKAAEAKAAEEQARAQKEADAQAQEAKAKAEQERGALKAGFDKLVQESSKLAAEREAFEKEKARLQAERARLELERQSLDELKRSALETEEARRSKETPQEAPATGVGQKVRDKKDTRKRDERIDEKEERLLKKLREQQRRMIERSRSKERLMRSPRSLPQFELAPIEESSLLSPSWGALGLTVHSFSRLSRELATLAEAGDLDSPTLKALFLRLSLATGSEDALTWERYLLFRHLVVKARPKLLSQPHGLALYRHLKALAHSTQICHSPSLIAGERLH